jgi:CubicO group peptidase (beta-lactamase class C family)
MTPFPSCSRAAGRDRLSSGRLLRLTVPQLVAIVSLVFVPALPVEVGAQEYVPERHRWERRGAASQGMDPDALRAAIEFAVSAETTGTRDLGERQPMERGREPLDAPVGPVRDRGPMTGIVVRNGYIVAEWGDVERVDMTFSVTKSFLSSTAGLAWQDGLIGDLDDAVRGYVPPTLLPPGDGEPGTESVDAGPGRKPVTLFDSEHNRKITWDHLLRQTSDWEGTLWGKPDWADRPGDDLRANRYREHNEPGSVYKYNDTRVNVLALALQHVWRRPLPQVLRERIMDPIGASSTWRWHGYENSWILLDGQRVQVVSGGGHWGGGMFISALDQARFGLLTLRQGRWGERQLLDPAWYEMAETPGSANPGYGFMNWFLNTDRRAIPAAPETAFVHRGAGTNIIYVDRENDLVVVARWIQNRQVPELIERVLAAIADGPGSEPE